MIISFHGQFLLRLEITCKNVFTNNYNKLIIHIQQNNKGKNCFDRNYLNGFNINKLFCSYY